MRGVQCMCSVGDDTIYNHIIVEKKKKLCFFYNVIYYIWFFIH